MALTNTIINPYTIQNGRRRKYTVTAADLAALGAFTTGTIILDTIPAGSIATFSRVKHSAAVSGGAITASTAKVQFNGTDLATALDVFAAPGTTEGTHDKTDITGVVGTAPGGNTANITLVMTSTTANLSAVTAGSIDVWVDIVQLGG